MFRALRVSKALDAPTPQFRVDLIEDANDDMLGEGDVIVDVEYSSLNFKDGMALQADPGVMRINPLVPGIDLVGRVASSEDPRWNIGDPVIVNGFGIGETHNGGYAERARVSGDWLVPRPLAISSERAAAIGTAGFTAMLAVLALERADATGGDLLVTGAAGGVGSTAIAILAKLGHRITASTGRPEEAEYLRGLGAAEIIDRGPLGEPGRPLQKELWSGAIDSVGGQTLVNVLAQTRYGGAVAACGLAQSAELPGTVLPFILRGVSLAGINSVFAPAALRAQAWQRLATDLDFDLLDAMTTTIALSQVEDAAKQILAGRVRGRTVVAVQS